MPGLPRMLTSVRLTGLLTSTWPLGRTRDRLMWNSTALHPLEIWPVASPRIFPLCNRLCGAVFECVCVCVVFLRLVRATNVLFVQVLKDIHSMRSYLSRLDVNLSEAHDAPLQRLATVMDTERAMRRCVLALNGCGWRASGRHQRTTHFTS